MKKTTSLVLVLTLGLAAEVANADFTFGIPTNLGPMVNSSSEDAGQSVSPNGLSLYFSSDRSAGSGDYDLWVSTRADLSKPWGTPVNLGSVVNSASIETSPSLLHDSLSLFFSDGVWPCTALVRVGSASATCG